MLLALLLALPNANSPQIPRYDYQGTSIRRDDFRPIVFKTYRNKKYWDCPKIILKDSQCHFHGDYTWAHKTTKYESLFD